MQGFSVQAIYSQAGAGRCSQGHLFMEKDACLLREMASDSCPKVHFYRWHALELSLGHFSDPKAWLTNVEPSFLHSIARRPTGGGIMIHGRDFCFSFLIPASHSLYQLSSPELYQLWHSKILCRLDHLLKSNKQELGVTEEEIPFFQLYSGEEEGKTSDLKQAACFAKKSLYDGVANERKILGSAIRRTKAGILHQFCLQLALFLPQELSHLLSSAVVQRITTNNVGLWSFLPPDKQQKLLENERWYKLLAHEVLELFTETLCE